MADKLNDLFDLKGISHLVFNGNLTQCALSKKDHLVYIYKVVDINNHSTWELITTLDIHVQYVSGIDWSAQSNRMVTCSYDKTAYVWTYKNDKWNPFCVTFNLKVGYLTVSWNKRGDKFAAGTGNKQLLIGYYNEDSNMWLEQGIKAHKSSVVAAKIDPTSLFVISGSTDFQIYVSSCFFSIDEPFLTEAMTELVKPFGQVIYNFEPDSWATTVNWNLSGSLCYAASQNATIAVINPSKNKHDLISLEHSPVSFIVPINDTSFYAVGFDRQIYLYECTKDEWALKKKVIDWEGSSVAPKKGVFGSSNNPFTSVGGGVKDVMKIFNDNKGAKKGVNVKSEQNSNLHSSNISSINMVSNKLITSDYSGFIKYWDL